MLIDLVFLILHCIFLLQFACLVKKKKRPVKKMDSGTVNFTLLDAGFGARGVVSTKFLDTVILVGNI